MEAETTTQNQNINSTTQPIVRGARKRTTTRKSSVFKLRNDQDPFNFNRILPSDDYLIEEDFLQKTGCTSITLGPEPILQQCYICSICDPSKTNLICKYCYDNCHQQCRDIEGTSSDKAKAELNYKGEKEFSCYCGIRLKHRPPKAKKKERVACTMIQLDQALDVDIFYCETHEKTICCVCSVDCHRGCKITKRKENEDEIVNCLCEGDKHTSFNEIAFTFPLDEYQNLSGVTVWPIQILNILFSNRNTFDKLSRLFSSIINKNSKDVDDEMKEKFYPLLELFSNTFNRKFKTFYYHEDILDMFVFENLIDYIQNCQVVDPPSILLKFRLLFILLFVHLRKDFQMVKSLTSIDFMMNTILERILYKKILTRPTIFTHLIDKKYNLENLFKENNILKRIAMDQICHLMEIGMDYVNIEENQDEFEIGLKYLCFMLKRMIFAKGDLIKLIYSLYKFHSKFFDYISSDKNNIYSLLDIFMGLAEIFYMIPVNYNDIVVQEYLDENQSKDKKKDAEPEEITGFIHTKSEHGSLLFKMILKSCDILKKHYLMIQTPDYSTKSDEDKKKEKQILAEKKHLQEVIENKTTGVKVKLPDNGGLFCEKIIKLFNETLRIFSLADNSYYKQLKSLKKSDLLEYYYFSKKIQNGYFSTMNATEGKTYYDALYNVKISIETKLNSLFTSSYSGDNLNINSKLFETILYFAETMKEKFSVDSKNDPSEEVNPINLNVSASGNGSVKEINLDKNPDALDSKNGMKKMNIVINEESDQNTEIKRKKYHDFIKKIIGSNEAYFSFLKSESFLKHKEDFVDCLIVSNIDETLGKLLVFFSNRRFPNLLTTELLDIILSFLSIFFLTKRGMKYFLMGKNLQRINKIINRFNCKPNNKNIDKKNKKTLDSNIRFTSLILNFMYMMVKGLKIYELELKDNKVMLRYKKNLLEHIEQFNLLTKDEKYRNDFKEQFTIVMKILYYLSDDFEYEDYEEIKRRVILIFKESPLNLFDHSSFTSNFNIVEEDEEAEQSQSQSESGSENEDVSNIGSDAQNLAKNLRKKAKKEGDKISEVSINLSHSEKLVLKENSSSSSINNVPDSHRSKEAKKNFKKQDTIYTANNDGNRKNMISLYFAFFNIVSKRTYYAFNIAEEESILNSIYNFDDLKDYKILLNTNQLTLKQKTVLLTYCRTFYFLDKLDPYNILLRNRQLTTLEFKQLIQSNTIVEQNIGEYLTFKEPLQLPSEKVKLYQQKYSLINHIMIVIQFFINELKKFPIQMKDCSSDHAENFLKELLFGIKFISNFFYFEKEIWSKAALEFYELVLEFLPKIELFKTVHREIIIYGIVTTFNVEPSEDVQKVIERIQTTTFNIYNKKELYKLISEGIEDIFKETNINEEICLAKYLEVFDKMAEANFTPFSLIETLDYEYFYEEESEEVEKELSKDVMLNKIKIMTDSFIKSFIDINNTNFLDVLVTISNETVVIDYRKKIVDYFHAFLNSIEGNSSYYLEALLCIITKMLFYDGEEMQERFEGLINDKFFFPNFNKLLNEYIVLTITLSKNIFAFDRALRISNLTKLIIQFMQALGEGFNTTYHDNIFRFQKDVPLKEDPEHDESESEDDDGSEYQDTNQPKSIKNTLTTIPNIVIKKTIYESVIYNLKRTFFFLDMDVLIDAEMPNDKLIILTTNFIDFLIEYIESTDDKNDIITKNLVNLLFGTKKDASALADKDIYEQYDYKPVLDVIFIKVKPDKKNTKLYLLRKKVICYTKMKYLQLLISYLQTGGKEKLINKLINSKCSPLELYTEILYNFRELINNLKLKDEKLYNSLIKIKNDDRYVQKLIDFYSHEKIFRDTIELPLCLKLYILIKTFEDMYSQYSLRDHFEKMKLDDSYSDNDTGDQWGIRSKFSHRVHLFLEKIVLKIEIKKQEDEDDEGDEGGIEDNTDAIAEGVVKKLKKKDDKSEKDDEEKEDKDDENNEEKEEGDEKAETKPKETEKEQQSDGEDEDEDDEGPHKKQNQNQITFFVRPYLTFSLSQHSKQDFEDKVDRTNATSKFVELISYSDYCLFEMVVNSHTIGKSKFLLWMSEINFYYVEIFNYILIIVQNVLIMRHFYRSPDLPSNLYDIVDEGAVYHLFEDNLFLSLGQICFLTIFLFIWYYFKFPNCYQKNLMQLYNRNFIFRKKGDKNKISQKIVDFFQDEEVTVVSVLRELNKDISYLKVIYASIIESMLINREMNILLCTLILNVLYFCFRSSMFLVIPVLFIANIIPTLFDIFKAMKMKFSNMITVLLFEYLLVYLFMWITYFYMADLFVFDDVLERVSEATITESFCYSSVQCFLFIVQQGVRAGGGIGDIINKVSYQSDPGFFMLRFVYDMLFFILIILVLGNVFLGIIVDTFAELRDQNSSTDNDKSNICFICQLSRDACLTRNIDFNKHVKTVHFLWNYVYFLTYLHINNPNDFNRVENSVWERLEDQDFSWIPIEKGAED